MASQTLIDALRQFGEFDDPYEEPGTCLAYARDILDAALENICHDTKI